jgi:hypothetical protein
VAALDGRVLWSSGDVRTFFNCSPAAMQGRDVYVFFEKDRLQIKGSIDALAPNVTIDRDAIIRPRERKPRLVRVTITRAEDDETIYWSFASGVT